jgi:hypothetical protein
VNSCLLLVLRNVAKCKKISSRVTRSPFTGRDNSTHSLTQLAHAIFSCLHSLFAHCTADYDIVHASVVDQDMEPSMTTLGVRPNPKVVYAVTLRRWVELRGCWGAGCLKNHNSVLECEERERINHERCGGNTRI